MGQLIGGFKWDAPLSNELMKEEVNGFMAIFNKAIDISQSVADARKDKKIDDLQTGMNRLHEGKP
ncbi:MAG: hypothetical protein R2825_16025 [Saprospiraceae bacterium]